jgi:hypothetical protein
VKGGARGGGDVRANAFEAWANMNVTFLVFQRPQLSSLDYMSRQAGIYQSSHYAQRPID